MTTPMAVIGRQCHKSAIAFRDYPTQQTMLGTPLEKHLGGVGGFWHSRKVCGEPPPAGVPSTSLRACTALHNSADSKEARNLVPVQPAGISATLSRFLRP